MAPALSGVLVYLGCGLLGFIGVPRLFSWLALLGGLAALLLWAPGFPEILVGGPPWGVAVAGDHWARGIWALGLILHAAVLLHARGRPNPFHPLTTVLVGACLAGSLSRDLFNMYVLLDLTSLLALVLLALERRWQAMWAGFQYLILSLVGLILYLFGLGIVYGGMGTLSVSALAAYKGDFENTALAVGVGLLLAGAAVKTGLFLFGLWLPQAHGHAPTEASALLSGLVVKVGIVVLARLAEAFPVENLLLAMGILTGLGGIAYALWEKDLKVFLGFSTVSQLGYILVGIGLGVEMGAVFYAVVHGLCKGLLFLAAGEGVEVAGRREIAELANRLPAPAALALAVGTWAMAGLPPLAGFFAKSVLGQSLPGWAKWVLFALGVGTTAAFFRLIPLFHPHGRGRVGGLWFLGLMVMGVGFWGVLTVPGLVNWRLWGEAFLTAGIGYLLQRGLRVLPFSPPWFSFEGKLVSVLLGAVVMASLLALGWLR